jgi:hypothetical protein
MATDREHQDLDAMLDPKQPHNRPDESAMSASDDALLDPNDEIPVPIAMEPGEIDERAQVVEALRGKGPAPRTDTQIDPSPAP